MCCVLFPDALPVLVGLHRDAIFQVSSCTQRSFCWTWGLVPNLRWGWWYLPPDLTSRLPFALAFVLYLICDSSYFFQILEHCATSCFTINVHTVATNMNIHKTWNMSSLYTDMFICVRELCGESASHIPHMIFLHMAVCHNLKQSHYSEWVSAYRKPSQWHDNTQPR